MSQTEERQLFAFVKRDLMTIEPVVFLFLFSVALSSTASDYISVDKMCRVKLNIDDEICDAIQKQWLPNDEYDQKFFRYFFLKPLGANTLACLFSCILLLFVGGWSDRTGHRRVILLLPVIGRGFQIMNSFINIIFFYQIPLEVHIFFNEFFVNIFGGHTLLAFALLTFIFLTSSVEYRLYRIASISICSTSGMLLGMVFCKLIQRFISYGQLLGLSLIMNAMTSVYIIYAISDPKRTNEQIMYDGLTISESIKNFFNVEYFSETIQVICKKTPNNRELRLCIHFLSLTFIFAVVTYEEAIFELMAKYTYGWDQSRLNKYNVFCLTLSTTGLLTSVGIITKWFKYHESVLGIVSSISKIISSFIFCFMDKHIFFIGPFVNMFNDMSILAIASLCSKMLENHEVGKINALACVVANLVRLIYVPLYLFLHIYTSHKLPGPVYLIRAGYTLPVLFACIWLLFDHRKETTE